jgi:hypothetical protein
MSLQLNAKPPLLLPRKQVIRQSCGGGAAENHVVLAVGIEHDILGLLPDRCATVLLLVDSEGDANCRGGN